ncbi:MAG: YkgB family protein [Myxococcales bacterium]
MAIATSSPPLPTISVPMHRSAPIAPVADSSIPERLDAFAALVLRYGLVAVILFFGAFKFTAAEAAGIQPLVSHSPFLSWLYSIGSVRAASDAIGSVEIAIAVLIAARRFSPALSALGSLGAVGMFATTLSFLVTTPGVWASVPGFPLPVPNEIGAFLVKDLFLLGAALWSAAEALRAARSR